MNIRVGSIIHWRGRVPSTLAWKQIIFHSFRHDHQQKKLQKTHLYVSIWQCKYLVIIYFFSTTILNQNVLWKKEKQTLGSVSHIFKKTTPIKNGWHSISSNMTKHHINPKTHTHPLSTLCSRWKSSTFPFVHAQSLSLSKYFWDASFKQIMLCYTVVLSIRCNPFSRNSKYLSKLRLMFFLKQRCFVCVNVFLRMCCLGAELTYKPRCN